MIYRSRDIFILNTWRVKYSARLTEIAQSRTGHTCLFCHGCIYLYNRK